MKKYEVRMTMLVAVSVEVEAENDEQAEKRAMEKTAREEAYYLQHYDSIWERNVTEVNEAEQEPAVLLTFEELCDKLQYFSVDDNQHKTIGEICNECREYIRKAGHNCLDDGWDSDADAKEWLNEHHPDLATDDIEETTVTYGPLEFLCENKYSGDLCFAELHITFYGDYKEGKGVFVVNN